jgi:hypothetical protein
MTSSLLDDNPGQPGESEDPNPGPNAPDEVPPDNPSGVLGV